MQTRTYTERSNARRAARAAGVDPGLVFATDDGFTFPSPEDVEYAEQRRADEDLNDRNWPVPPRETHINGNGVDAATSAKERKLENAAAIGLDIPEFLRVDPDEERPQVPIGPTPRIALAMPKEDTITMPKSKKAKRETKPSGSDKNATLMSMLSKGATVPELTKALDWLPHTLRARISRITKAKKDGGEGLKVERSRTDGVTSYKIA